MSHFYKWSSLRHRVKCVLMYLLFFPCIHSAFLCLLCFEPILWDCKSSGGLHHNIIWLGAWDLLARSSIYGKRFAFPSPSSKSSMHRGHPTTRSTTERSEWWKKCKRQWTVERWVFCIINTTLCIEIGHPCGPATAWRRSWVNLKVELYSWRTIVQLKVQRRWRM